MKIVEFTQKNEDFVEYAKLRKRNGDFLMAIKYYKKANKKYYTEIADCYLELKKYELALEYYLKAMLYCSQKITENLIGITTCYNAMDKIVWACFHFNLLLTQNKSLAYKEQIDKLALELKIFDSLANNKMPYKDTNTILFEKAKSLFIAQKFEESENLFKSINSHSKYYIPSLNNLTKIALIKNDINSAQNYACEILKIDEHNITALCNLACVYMYKSDKVASISTIKHAMAQKNLNTMNRIEIATALCSLNAHKLAITYLETVLKELPNHYDFSLLYAIANYNIGNKEVAIKILNNMLDYYENDIIYTYYKNEFLKNMQNDIVIAYSNFIPPDKNAELKEDIAKLINKVMQNNYEINSTDLELLIWAYNNTTEPFYATITNTLINSSCINSIYELLLSSRISNQAKNVMVKELILSNKTAKVKICYEGLYSTINLNKIKSNLEKQNLDEAILLDMGIKFNEAN